MNGSIPLLPHINLYNVRNVPTFFSIGVGGANSEAMYNFSFVLKIVIKIVINVTVNYL
jgi:hypothetical protein